MKGITHGEIRFSILHSLYQGHYGGNLNQPQMTETVISSPDLSDIDKNLVYGDVVYLVESGRAKGEYMLGRAAPFAITPTSFGIDTVGNIMNDFFTEVNNHDLPGRVKEELLNIGNESTPNIVIRKLWEYAKANDEILIIFRLSISRFLGN